MFLKYVISALELIQIYLPVLQPVTGLRHSVGEPRHPPHADIQQLH